MSTSLTLYHYWRSSCSWRVRWALAHKGLNYTSHTINLLQKEHEAAAFRQINPACSLPVLVTDSGQVYTESMAILEWLEERFPNAALLPQDPDKRAQVRALAYQITMGIQPLQNLRVLNYWKSRQQPARDYGRYWIEQGLHIVEAKLRNTSGSFAFGSQLSFADLCLIPQIYNAKRFQVALQNFPICERLFNHCMSLSSCFQAAPEQQPDAQP